MTSNLTRRAAVASIAAAPVAMLPASIAAAAPPAAADDAELVALWHQLLAARAEVDRIHEIWKRADAAVTAALPPIPPEIRRQGDLWPWSEGVLRERRAWHPKLEQHVALSNVWHAERRRLEGVHGVTEAADLDEAAQIRMFAIENDIEATVPTTVVGAGVHLALARLRQIDEAVWQPNYQMEGVVENLIRLAGLDPDVGYFTGFPPGYQLGTADDGAAEAVRVA